MPDDPEVLRAIGSSRFGRVHPVIKQTRYPPPALSRSVQFTCTNNNLRSYIINIIIIFPLILSCNAPDDTCVCLPTEPTPPVHRVPGLMTALSPTQRIL